MFNNMNTFQASKALSQVFNTLGNKWIQEYLAQEPYSFTVFLRRTGHDEEHLGNYIAEVYTDRFVPRKMTYNNSGFTKEVTYELLEEKLGQLAKYIEFSEPIVIKLMELDYR